MRLFFLFVATIVGALPVCAHHDQLLDSLYQALDEAIEHSPVYVAERRRTIQGMEAQLRKAATPSQAYALSYELWEAYRPFCSDSAFCYIDNCIALATREGRQADAATCQARKAFLCSTTGMFVESLQLLHAIDASQLDNAGREAYYRACAHLYRQLSYYTTLADQRAEYRDKSATYDSLLVATLTPQSPHYMQMLEETAIHSGDHAQAMMVNNEWIDQVEEGSHEYAIAAFYRYLELMGAQDSLQMMQWLVRSALTDVKNAIMDQGSMWELANQLMAAGEIDRAYRYIDFASKCAEHFGTRLRSWQIAPIISSASRNYQEKNRQQSRQMWLLLVVISLLALALLASLLFVLRQRNRIKTVNKQLQQSMHQLSVTSRQQADLNARLTELNSRLAESNHVKEEYVGRFMQQCSFYIDKMDDMRRQVSRMVKNNDHSQLLLFARSTEFKEKELEEFYHIFDTAFLHLFPDFIDKFNALLRPEERATQPGDGKLTTTLRIFALIRLGIEDSSKIAEFLHYSVNTIYNYRARVKNGAISDREHFDERVKTL